MSYGPQQPYPPHQPPPRRLQRSRTDRFLGGVCGGTASYLNMDATLVRILTVALSVVFPVTIVAYIILLFALPEAPAGPTPQVRPRPAEPPFGAPSYRAPNAQPDPVWGAGGAPWESHNRNQPEQQPQQQRTYPQDPPARD